MHMHSTYAYGAGQPVALSRPLDAPTTYPTLATATQVREIQGLLKELPPPLNAEYLPIPVEAIQLRACTHYASGVTSTVEMATLQT